MGSSEGDGNNTVKNYTQKTPKLPATNKMKAIWKLNYRRISSSLKSVWFIPVLYRLTLTDMDHPPNSKTQIQISCISDKFRYIFFSENHNKWLLNWRYIRFYVNYVLFIELNYAYQGALKLLWNINGVYFR